MKIHKLKILALSFASIGFASYSIADQVVSGDTLIQGNLCVGFDCDSTTNFDGSNLKLKANNLRFYFIDTDTLDTCPNNQVPFQSWFINFNDAELNGESYLQIGKVTSTPIDVLRYFSLPDFIAPIFCFPTNGPSSCFIEEPIGSSMFEPVAIGAVYMPGTTYYYSQTVSTFIESPLVTLSPDGNLFLPGNVHEKAKINNVIDQGEDDSSSENDDC